MTENGIFGSDHIEQMKIDVGNKNGQTDLNSLKSEAERNTMHIYNNLVP